MTAIYLYGFIDELPVCRRQALVECREFRMDQRFGIGLLPLAGSHALVCRVDEAEYRDPQSVSPAWLAARATRHAGLLCSLVTDCAVLPVRFGTVFSTEKQLRTAVDEPAIAAALSQLRGMTEWSVKLLVDDAAAIARLRECDPVLREKFMALSSTPGARYLQERQLESLVASVLSDHLRARSSLLRQSLQSLAVAVMHLPPAPDAAEHGPHIVGHFGVLLNRTCEPRIHAVLEALAHEWAADGAWIELGGPWPAYDFCPSLLKPDATDDRISL